MDKKQSKAKSEPSKPLTKREQRKAEQEALIMNKWPDQRKMGKKKYVLKFGLINWGLSTFVFYWAFLILVNRFTSTPTPYSIWMILFSLVFFIVFGLVQSNMIWNRNERLFNDKFPYRKEAKAKRK